MATNFWPKFAKDLDSACWRHEMGWNIAMPIGVREGAMILHSLGGGVARHCGDQ